MARRVALHLEPGGTTRRLGLGCVLMVTEENELLVTRAMAARVTLLRQPVALGEPLDLGPDCVPD